MDADQESKDKKRVQYKSYGSSAMEKAIAAVQSEGKTMYRASKDFGVPMNTLRDRLMAKGLLKPKRTALQDEDDKVPAKQTKPTEERAKPSPFTIEDNIRERWQNIGKSEGLTGTAAIVEFLVSLYYNAGKQEEHKTDIRCPACQNPLTLFCTQCQLVPPPSVPCCTSSSSKRAAHKTGGVSVSHSGTKAPPLSPRNPSEHTDPQIKTEQNSITAVYPKRTTAVSLKRTRTKRLMQSCENSKTLRGVEISQGRNKTMLRELVEMPHAQNKTTIREVVEISHAQNKITIREVEMPHAQNKTTIREVEISHEQNKTLREGEASSSDDDNQSLLVEDSIAVELLPEIQEDPPDSGKNGETFKDSGSDPAYSVDDFLLEDLQEETDKKPKKRRECPECGESFEDAVGLQRHLAASRHNPRHVCRLCGKSFKNKSGFLQHQRVHRRQEQQCPVCGLSFRFPSRLSKHLKTHGTERPHVCDKCGKSFVSVYYLRDHIQIHGQERPYRCQTCGATFKQKPALYAHAKIHSNEKPFQCQYCGLKYRDSQKMKIHVRTHTGEKPYQCPMCDARFVSNSNMWQHLAYVHGKSTKTHQCPHCPLTFAAKGKLRIHLKNAHLASSQTDDAGGEGGAGAGAGAESGEGGGASSSSSCQLEVMTEGGEQPFYIELPGGNPSDTSLTSVGTLCHVSLSL